MTDRRNRASYFAIRLAFRSVLAFRPCLCAENRRDSRHTIDSSLVFMETSLSEETISTELSEEKDVQHNNSMTGS